jgi:hypothetical protein
LPIIGFRARLSHSPPPRYKALGTCRASDVFHDFFMSWFVGLKHCDWLAMSQDDDAVANLKYMLDVATYENDRDASGSQRLD